MMIGRLARSLVLAAVVSMLVAGCVTSVPNQADTTMDHREAKAELTALVDIAQDSVGGAWEGSDTGARDCAIEGGGQGANYTMSRIGSGVAADSQQPVVDAIIEAWAEKGVEAVVSTKPEVKDVVVTQLRYPNAGLGSGGFYVEVWISDRASSVAGQTRCANGDPAVINAP
jgi:hypothetical protein